jgi:hypothetical protein
MLVDVSETLAVVPQLNVDGSESDPELIKSKAATVVTAKTSNS